MIIYVLASELILKLISLFPLHGGLKMHRHTRTFSTREVADICKLPGGSREAARLCMRGVLKSISVPSKLGNRSFMHVKLVDLTEFMQKNGYPLSSLAPYLQEQREIIDARLGRLIISLEEKKADLNGLAAPIMALAKKLQQNSAEANVVLAAEFRELARLIFARAELHVVAARLAESGQSPVEAGQAS
jgi:hypothetical protein